MHRHTAIKFPILLFYRAGGNDATEIASRKAKQKTCRNRRTYHVILCSSRISSANVQVRFLPSSLPIEKYREDDKGKYIVLMNLVFQDSLNFYYWWEILLWKKSMNWMYHQVNKLYVLLHNKSEKCVITKGCKIFSIIPQVKVKTRRSKSKTC